MGLPLLGVELVHPKKVGHIGHYPEKEGSHHQQVAVTDFNKYLGLNMIEELSYDHFCNLNKECY